MGREININENNVWKNILVLDNFIGKDALIDKLVALNQQADTLLANSTKSNPYEFTAKCLEDFTKGDPLEFYTSLTDGISVKKAKNRFNAIALESHAKGDMSKCIRIGGIYVTEGLTIGAEYSVDYNTSTIIKGDASKRIGLAISDKELLLYI